MRIPLLLSVFTSAASAALSLLPTPQYVEPLDHQILLSKEATVAIILNNQRADKMRLAAEALARS